MSISFELFLLKYSIRVKGSNSDSLRHNITIIVRNKASFYSIILINEITMKYTEKRYSERGPVITR